MTSLFDVQETAAKRSQMPLAARMRPKRLEDVVGQEHLLAPGGRLRRMVDAGFLGSLILAGPPGTGKTTLAELLAKSTGAKFRTLSATSGTVKDVRSILGWADDLVSTGQNRPVLFVDEIHRFSKSQQDALLPDVESGTISLIGATTSNPHFAVNAALLSRSQVFMLQPIEPDAMKTLIDRALVDQEDGLGQCDVAVSSDAVDHLANACNGDARRALTALEIAVRSVPMGTSVDATMIAEILGGRIAGYDGTGDDHYDLTSALIKSIRGSDADAAIYWLARMLEGGEDIRFICRRLVILASEDIGNADPQALVVATAATQACEFVGLPECQLTLSQTVIYLALAPKSNSATTAIGQAKRDVQENTIVPVPMALRDTHYRGAESLGHGKDYLYAHDHPDGIVEMDYLGVDRQYYHPVPRGFEAELSERYEATRKKLLRNSDDNE